MKKIIVALVALLMICYFLNQRYVYTEHKAYIYKFVTADKKYSIIFNDTYNEHITIDIDSENFFHMASKEMRKRFYKIRRYESGRTLLLK